MKGYSQPGRGRAVRLLRVALMVSACAVLPTEPVNAEAANPVALLDGYHFLGAASGGADHEDFVQFADGRFFSAGRVRWGFGDAAYEAWHEGGAVRFRTVTSSSGDGTLECEGANPYEPAP